MERALLTAGTPKLSFRCFSKFALYDFTICLMGALLLSHLRLHGVLAQSRPYPFSFALYLGFIDFVRTSVPRPKKRRVSAPVPFRHWPISLDEIGVVLELVCRKYLGDWYYGRICRAILFCSSSPVCALVWQLVKDTLHVL